MSQATWIRPDLQNILIKFQFGGCLSKGELKLVNNVFVFSIMLGTGVRLTSVLNDLTALNLFLLTVFII